MSKPWYAEREFALTVLSVVGGVALLIAGKEEIGMALLATSVAGFSVSRGLAKGGGR